MRFNIVKGGGQAKTEVKFVAGLTDSREIKLPLSISLSGFL